MKKDLTKDETNLPLKQKIPQSQLLLEPKLTNLHQCRARFCESNIRKLKAENQRLQERLTLLSDTLFTCKKILL